jgi:uncharacterized protein
METVEFPSPSRPLLSQALSSRILELVILPTEDCNFRCVYCYEDHAPGRMSPEIVTGIKRLLDRRMEDIRFLRTSWFGGEPLMAKDIVFDISEFALRRCREHGVEFAGDVTTNGYFLTPDVAARLVAANQKRFFVSLAGVGADHDRLRPLASGRGSFERIWANLIALRGSSLDFDMSLRLHFGTDAAARESLCREVNLQLGKDRRLSASLQRIVDLGGENTGRFATTTAEEARQIVRHLAGLMPDIEVSNLEPTDAMICTAARPNNLLIRADGRICRCAAHLNDSINVVGRLDSMGRMNLDRERLRPWFKGYDAFDGKMLSCPYASVPRDLWPRADRLPLPKTTSTS